VSGRDGQRNLTGPQLRAVSVLLVGASTEDAAHAAGVSQRTIERWQATDGFQDALRDFARASFREAHRQLLAAAEEAVATLREALRIDNAATRVRAARVLLELGLKVADADLDERLERLERLEQAWQANETGTNGLRLLSS
jgi:hypothetical protein